MRIRVPKNLYKICNYNNLPKPTKRFLKKIIKGLRSGEIHLQNYKTKDGIFKIQVGKDYRALFKNTGEKIDGEQVFELIDIRNRKDVYRNV